MKRKLLLLTSILLSTILLSAQDKLSNQLLEILRDTVNGFTKFIGAEKMHGETSQKENIAKYSTLTSLDHTKENYITHLTGDRGFAYTYHAMISDSIHKKKAHQLCSEWKNKLLSVLAEGAKIERIAWENNPETYGWIIKKGKLVIHVSTYPDMEKSLYWVWLEISYVSYSSDK